MDNISVPSRFSCLKIEDEDLNPAPKLKKKPENFKQNGKKNNSTNNMKKSVPKQVKNFENEICNYTIYTFRMELQMDHPKQHLRKIKLRLSKKINSGKSGRKKMRSIWMKILNKIYSVHYSSQS